MSFRISCCLFVSIGWLSLPLASFAQNLISDGGFNKRLKTSGVYGMTVGETKGRWSAVDIVDYGWEKMPVGNQNFMTVKAPFALTSENKQVLKGLVQGISDAKQTTGKCTLRFNYFLKNPQWLGGEGTILKASVYGFSGDSSTLINLHEPLSSSVPGLTLLANTDFRENGEKTTWDSYSLPVDLGRGYDIIIVAFNGTGLKLDAGVANVAFFSNSGSIPAEMPAPSSIPERDASPAKVTAPIQKPAPAVSKPAPAISRPARVAPRPKPAVAPARPQPQEPPQVSPSDVIRGNNLTRDGDFSRASLAVPPSSGYYSSQLSGRWLRSNANPWMIEEDGGNLGAYARVASGSTQARLLYVACNQKNSTGPHRLTFDYVITDSSDLLAATVFAVDQNLLVGTSSGQFHLDKGALPGMTELEPSMRWKNGSLSVDLGNGYDYIYILFVGTGAGYTGIDNVTLSPDNR